MSQPVVFNLFGHDDLKNNICKTLHYEPGNISIHDFPDEETLVTLNSSVANKLVIFILATDRPNKKLATLLFAAETARELGAKKVGLIAPYLAYMRQDKQFHPGEGVTSKYFAKIISSHFDWLLTIDPHLHRWHALDQLYTIPTITLHAASLIAEWIKTHCVCPVLIGPDVESRQWIAAIAKAAHAPFLMVDKQRMGDRLVKATIPNIESYPEHTPIIIDDIISTAVTMLETIHHLQSQHIQAIQCIGVHAIFSNSAYDDLLAAGIAQIATCNTIQHPSNKIDISPLIIAALPQLE